MKKLGNINIIGTEYTVYYYPNEFKELNQDSRERDERYGIKRENPEEKVDGYCDYSAKEIRIFNDDFTHPEYFQMIMRHEICHAFLFEIGNTNHNNEEMIDKLSKWTPQIMRLTEEGMEMIKRATSKKEPRSKKTDK